MRGLITAGSERALRSSDLGGLDRNLAPLLQPRLSPDDGDLVLLHQEGHAVVQALGHLARTLHHRLGIIADLASAQAVTVGMLKVVVDLRRSQQGLGRNAPPVETDAAQILALDNGSLE